MKIPVPLLLLSALIGTSLAAAEPSAFGAGDLSKDNPYGLTESEKHILKNKNELKEIEKKTYVQGSKVETLLERLDGLQTIVEGLSEKSHAQQLESTTLKNDEKDRYDKLLSRVDANEKNILEFKTLLSELSKVIDNINSKYISKNEFNTLVKEINALKDNISKELKSGDASKTFSSEFSGLSNAEIENEARDFYDKKYYTKAIERYEYLLEKNYKPARDNYMLGEIYYYRKKYDQAISYFKESATLYENASYMPILMLHTAAAMQNIGDIKNAKAFYEAIISKYPDDSVSKDAKKRIEKLK
jgi:TolA-binding protein